MKTRGYLFSVVILLIIAAAACHHNVNSIIVNNGKERLEINYSGQIKFTEDETSIQSMTNGSQLKYWKNDKKLIVKCDAGGAISYEMRDDGRKLNPEDAEGRKFLTEAIQGMISVGFDAKGRMKRIAEKGGLRAVLMEVGRLNNDYMKSMYLEWLITCDSIHSDMVTEIAKKIGNELDTDYEKGKLLGKFPAAFLSDSLVSRAYFDAVKSIGSDFEKANSIKRLIKQSLTKEQFDMALSASDALGSDFEKANVLKELMHQEIVEKDNLVRFLRSVDQLGSDFEKANLLKAVINQKRLEGESFNNLLRSVNRLGSDFEKANMLKQLAGKEISAEEQWIKLINETALVSSDFERCNILVQIAGKMPRSEPVKTSYLKALKTIGSEFEYGRAAKALN